jgi:carbon-monoxide dehydrogenase medium subunit
MLVGRRVDADLALAAGRALAAAAEPHDDVRASAAYRRRVIPALVARALAEALAP